MGLKILHVVSALGTGGASRLACDLALYQRQEGCQVELLSLFNPRRGGMDTWMSERLAENGVPVHYLDKKTGLDLRMFWRAQKTVVRAHPQVIHTHGYSLRYVAPSIVCNCQMAKVHTVHSIAEREASGLDRLLRRWLFARDLCVVSISKAVTDSIQKTYGRLPDVEIPNGVRLSETPNPSLCRQAWRDTNGFSENDILFVNVAMMRPEKNQDLLLRAFANGPADDARACLLIVGDGDKREELERLAADLHLQSRVFFLGVRNDIVDILAASDVFVLTSRWEGNPLSVMEAMVAGLPVIATAVGGVPELVSHGESGILCESENEEEIALAMMSLLQDTKYRRKLARYAKNTSHEFDLSVMGESYQALYENLLRAS